MTQAICLKCGAAKIGALTPCLTCRFDPATPEEKARSVVLSSHHMDATSLENAAKAIQAGQEIPMPEDLIASLAKTITSTPKPRGTGCFMIGCLISGILTGLAILAAIIAFLGGRWITGLYRICGGAGLAYFSSFCSDLFFLWEQSEFPGRDRKKRWVLINAIPVATVVIAIVYFALHRRF